jgi:uncharacterized protein
MRTSRSDKSITMGVAIVCVLSCWAIQAAAQDGALQDGQALQPEVVTSGTADVTIAASTASFSVDISSLAASAATASAESTRISKAVSNALRAAGLSHEEIAQSQFTVAPRWEYDQATRKQKRTGYEATTVIELETDRLDRLGTYMDAALSAGATTISAISFSAKDTNEARRRALARAVAQARADAETIARAGGGTLGQLLLLTTEPESSPRAVEINAPLVAMAPSMAGAERPNIIPSQIKVTATVVGRWKLVAGTALR